MDQGPAGDESTFSRQVAAAGQSALDRLASFRPIYLAVFLFVLLYVFSIGAVETWLTLRFRNAAQAAVVVTDLEIPVAEQIQRRVSESVTDTVWVRVLGVRVSLHVFGRDGRILVLNGRSTTPPGMTRDPAAILREAESTLPASAVVDDVSVPIDSVLSSLMLIVYGAALLQGLFLYNRSVSRRQGAVLDAAQEARERAAEKASSIESELARVRDRLLHVEPTEREQAAEIENLQQERARLQRQLSELAAREEELRSNAVRASDLDQERQALEDLLEEAVGDLDSKNAEIEELERSLKKASRRKGSGSGRGREVELWAKRLRTLYKDLEIDDRAVEELVGLSDEPLKLKAEEAIKRLADDADNVALRRKLGGLPPHLSILELGFAGKGRIYYTKGRQRRFRVLTIGTKASQKTDLEYLSRLSADDLA